MESRQDFEQRRANEAAELEQGSFRLEPKPGSSMEFQANRPIRQNCVLAAPETNWLPLRSVTVGDYRMNYSYRRFDLQVTGPPVYPDLGSPSLTYYTSSGMAAIAAVVLALDRILNTEVEFWCTPDGYFETQHLVRAYARMLKVQHVESLAPAAESSTSLACLHIDSIARIDPVAQLMANEVPWGRVLLSLIDTTCYTRSDPQINRISALLSSHGVCQVLVRSHIKLDGFGTECARFGSVVVCDAPCPNEAERELVHSLRKVIPDVIRCFGFSPLPEAMLPLRQGYRYMELNEQRAARIKENSRLVAVQLVGALSQSRYAVREYHHGMFVTVHHPMWSKPGGTDDLLERVMRGCSAVAVTVRRATSFGFDFTVLCEIFDMVTGLYCVRVSVSDEPEPAMTLMAQELSQALVESSPD